MMTTLAAPAALRELRAWLVWKFEPNGDKKPRKVPYYAHGGRRTAEHGSDTDRAQLVAFEDAIEARDRRGMDGVGVALLEGSGIVALDFDNCIVEGGPTPEVDALVANTYAELSPSGRGVRAFVCGTGVGNRKSNGAEWPFGFETFETKGYVTFTGNVLATCEMLGNENTIAPISETLKALYAKRFAPSVAEAFDAPEQAGEPIGLTPAQINQILAALPDDLPYEASKGPSWLGVGMAIHHETGGSEDGFELWDDWSQRSPKYSTREYGLARWQSFGRGGQRPTTARALIKWGGDAGVHVRVGDAADDFEDVSGAANPVAGEANAAPAVPEPRLRFPVVPAAEFAAGKHPGWIIKGVLPRGEVVVAFGEPGSGKSFVAIDMSMAVARAVDWRGHRSKGGRVAYIAAEGGGGFRARLAAYAKHYGVDLVGLPFGVIHAAPNFLEKADAVDVAKAILAAGGADLVVVDTFAQVTPGANENAAEDVGKALAHCRGIHRATGATVLLVHHAGKDASKGARGWSGLKAAADAEFEILRNAAGERGIRVSKQKDGEDGALFGFGLQMLPVGVDEDGDPVTSCVVVDAEAPTRGGDKVRRLGPVEKIVTAVVNEIAQSQTAGIEIEAIVAEVARRMPAPDGARDTRKQHAKRALKRLCEGDDAPYFEEEGGCISVG